ncbi:MFS transporter [Fundicoccus culcitae]|uniref:MFS transporter n=1 Tax=Fundicoccus culcitae TaxID=2969821 RepID=A0ABY5P985_9LACT|nr:MFS transporter [Fundicoccus culcitae]UUX35317.1 MFS transporter [Fundicoccus culcitae]
MTEETQKSIYPPNYWKRIVFTFFMGWLVIWIYRSMLSPVYDEIQLTIGPQSNTAMGSIASMYFFGYTAMQIPSGFLVDKFGQKKVLIPGFIVFAIGVASIGFATNITMIYIGSVLAGLGCGCYYGSAFSLTTQHVPQDKKGVGTAIVNSGSAVGMIIGMIGSSFLVKSLGMPWQVLPVISASLIVLLIIWFATKLISPKAEEATLKTETGSNIQEEIKEVQASKGSLFRPELLTVYLLYFTTCYAYYLIVTWLPDFLASERGIEGTMIGFITSMIAVTAIPGALYFSRKSDQRRDSKKQIIIFLSLVSFVLIALSMFAPGEISLSIILLLYGFFGKMAVDPVLISYLSDMADEGKVASTLGIFNFFGMASSVVAPALTGYIMDKTGSGEWGFYIGAFFLILGTVVFYLGNRKTTTA